jgi:hypothetical protein
MKIIPAFRRNSDPIDKKHSPPGVDVDVTITSSF